MHNILLFSIVNLVKKSKYDTQTTWNFKPYKIVKVLKCYDWFTSYLTNRKEYTVIGHNQSALQIITCGIPQGSVLGSLLFLMYVNDIHKAVPDVNIRLFADNTNMFIHDKNCKTLTQTVNENLSKLNDWLTVNKLSLNLNKTCYSVYSSDKINDFKIALNGVEIRRVKVANILALLLMMN